MAHIYRLRRHRVYRQRRLHFTKTRPSAVSIGERRRPNPRGQPGYLRVDTVHQGDRDGVKGVYHINAVDEVTQWQVVGATAAISEAWLEPLLKAMLEQFPFRLRGFHSDNGSEFLNGTVEKLLNKAADRTDQVAAEAHQRQRLGGIEKRRRDPQAHVAYAHRGAARGAHPALLSTALQSLFELPPALRTTRTADRRQRQAEARVSPLSDPLGNLPEVAAGRRLSPSPGRRSRPSTVLLRPEATLRRRGGCNKPRASCLRVSHPRTCRAARREKGCGNDGRWETRKTKNRFPSFPNALGNRSAIPTFPQPRRRFSPLLNQSQKGAQRLSAPLLLQAHPSMRKCFGTDHPQG